MTDHILAKNLYSPELGSKSPSNMPRVEVLPAPLPPSKPTVDPRARSKEILSTATTLPNRFERSRTLTIVSDIAAQTGPTYFQGQWLQVHKPHLLLRLMSAPNIGILTRGLPKPRVDLYADKMSLPRQVTKGFLMRDNVHTYLE